MCTQKTYFFILLNTLKKLQDILLESDSTVPKLQILGEYEKHVSLNHHFQRQNLHGLWTTTDQSSLSVTCSVPIFKKNDNTFLKYFSFEFFITTGDYRDRNQKHRR